jgi:hypothetical protein
VFDNLPCSEVWIPTWFWLVLRFFYSLRSGDWPFPRPNVHGQKRIKGGVRASIASVLKNYYHNILIHSPLAAVDNGVIIRFWGEAQAVMGT